MQLSCPIVYAFPFQVDTDNFQSTLVPQLIVKNYGPSTISVLGHNILHNIMALGLIHVWFKYHAYYLLAEKFWTSNWNSLNLNFFIYKICKYSTSTILYIISTGIS